MPIQNVTSNLSAISSYSSSSAANSSNQIVSIPASSTAEQSKSSVDNPPSAIVTLSAQAQKLSMSHSQTDVTRLNQNRTPNRPDTASSERVSPLSKAANNVPGIQFLQSETSGGRVNTYA